MDYFNVIIRKRDNTSIIDFMPYEVQSAELTSGDYIVIYKDGDTTFTGTYSETDYVMYIVPKYEIVYD